MILQREPLICMIYTLFLRFNVIETMHECLLLTEQSCVFMGGVKSLTQSSDGDASLVSLARVPV